jgi:hypothetical protein
MHSSPDADGGMLLRFLLGLNQHIPCQDGLCAGRVLPNCATAHGWYVILKC